ncbi:thiamine-phosphate kinase [Flexibacterium corallicola]|uniref:thiamine-phosphate kinase n=1 Tax=Flexibacterium corallicola TaxID=3037259 RepID=UPI00286F8927|nr:thiamine-phosphate kinase [Pseudovibrio sp. M1P-2-3]
MSGGRAGEFTLIERYFAPLATHAGAAGLTDDAATLTPPEGCELVLTKDMLASGVHFFPEDPPQSVARKALGVNLSDLAAKGARPLGYLLGLGLPKDFEEAWVRDFCKGLELSQRQYGWALLGGDTIKSPDGILLSITAIGCTPTGRAVRRNTAPVGARLYVTGTIGDAALGLMLRLAPENAHKWGLTPTEEAFLLERYLHPKPRAQAAQTILEYGAASMDVSDGLLADLAHMCHTSKVDAHVDLEKVPLSAGVHRACSAERELLHQAVTGGDDYEILCAVPENACEVFEKGLKASGLPCSQIGYFSAPANSGSGVPNLYLHGERVLGHSSKGFEHF